MLVGLISLTLFAVSACERANFGNATVSPRSMRDVPAQRLGYRLESDVPTPAAANEPTTSSQERLPIIQTDFDQNRPQETLDRTILSPDKQRILVVFRKVNDLEFDYRLDMYGVDGKLIRKITPGAMAIRFPDVIVWSPDSQSVAFVAVTRGGLREPEPVPSAPTLPQIDESLEPKADANSNSANADANINSNANIAPSPTPAVANQPVLTFSTEQIYLCGKDGGDLKPLTQKEGLIYFYFVWSPDSAALLAMASKVNDWRVDQSQADASGKVFSPKGRPRILEKNGRERILDDNLADVQPVWSPDSSKVAAAYNKDIRIYDFSDSPTQAALLLKNPLLISSQTFDQTLRQKEQGANANSAAPANTSTANEVSTLPSEDSLVSYNPIVALKWTDDKTIFLETAYVQRFKIASDSVRSYSRWHRLNLSPQAVSTGN